MNTIISINIFDILFFIILSSLYAVLWFVKSKKKDFEIEKKANKINLLEWEIKLSDHVIDKIKSTNFELIDIIKSIDPEKLPEQYKEAKKQEIESVVQLHKAVNDFFSELARIWQNPKH